MNSIFSGISTLQDHLISTVSISNNTLISYVIVYLDTWYSRLNSHLNNLSMVISIVMINSSVYNMSIKVILSVVSNIFQSVTSLFISGLVRYVLFKQQQVINIGMDLVITSFISISGQSSYIIFYDWELNIISNTSINSRYHLLVTFIGIWTTFIPMHCIGFNVMPRRILDFPDALNSWNYLSSLGSLTTLMSFFLLLFGMLWIILRWVISDYLRSNILEYQ